MQDAGSKFILADGQLQLLAKRKYLFSESNVFALVVSRAPFFEKMIVHAKRTSTIKFSGLDMPGQNGTSVESKGYSSMNNLSLRIKIPQSAAEKLEALAKDRSNPLAKLGIARICVDGKL